jgi:hypothetical protein
MGIEWFHDISGNQAVIDTRVLVLLELRQLFLTDVDHIGGYGVARGCAGSRRSIVQNQQGATYSVGVDRGVAEVYVSGSIVALSPEQARDRKEEEKDQKPRAWTTTAGIWLARRLLAVVSREVQPAETGMENLDGP